MNDVEILLDAIENPEGPPLCALCRRDPPCSCHLDLNVLDFPFQKDWDAFCMCTCGDCLRK